MQGKLIDFEGTDGSGKATQSRMLVERLQKEGYELKKLEFPRYSEESSALIRLYLDGKFGAHAGDVNAYAASTFYAVDRFASYRQDWGEFYEAGGLVIADRYTTSNAVHQGTKLPAHELQAYLEWLFHFEFDLMGLPAPTKVFYLDIPTEVTEKMMRKREADNNVRPDIHEQDGEYLRRCRENAQRVVDFCGWEKISCVRGDELRSIEDIHEEIYAKVRALL